MLRESRIGEVIRFDLARTLLGRGRYWTTAYLVDGMMIDTGCAHSAPELVAALAGRRVERIVNTHTHEDHIGANGPLLRHFDEVDVLAHPEALRVLDNPRREQPLHPYRRVMWGWPERCDAEAVRDGDEIATSKHRFRVVETPGHAPDHLCFWEPDRRWLFTGDLYVGGRDRALRSDGDIWTIIESLERINELDCKTLFPGAARVPEDPKSALASKLEYLRSLGEQVLELNERGLGEREITRRLCGPPMWIERITLGHFSRRHLVRSYLRGRG